MGRCKVRCTLYVWVSGLVAAWLDVGSSKSVFVTAGLILAPPELHFESFVALWGEPAAPGARHGEQIEQN